MPAKKVPRSGGKSSDDKESADVSHKSGSDPRALRKRKGQGWPWWLWGFGVICILACAGRLILGPAPAGSDGVTGRKVAGGKGGRKSQAAKGSTAAYLGLAMRLAQATDTAATLKAAGQLESKAARILDEELTAMEEEIDGLDGSTARDLRAMVSVVRGTLYQHAENLTDAEVEKLERSSFTYANPRYWDDYYNKTSNEERYDWYGSWDTSVLVRQANVADGSDASSTSTKLLGDLLRPHLERSGSQRILMLGCGNSDMSAKMYGAGFKNIVNIDISQSLVDSLRAQHEATMPEMQWVYMNASDLSFESASFDIVLDKGTLDAIEQNEPLLEAAVKEVHRALRPGGLVLSITFSVPATRVEKQLRGPTEWGSCVSQQFERSLGGTKAENSVYYVHACERP
eukprot:TRINITY_DN61399_c0_g1_i1.p1 TRINITY_DN61399_c0_g1~~TRINITY_DN61399_c0_g1_i1.p1  ORF type:complete len:400 (+),score=77.22 TRINITY_DN61399_c0_g1_i1:75-1274(+)